MLLGLCFDAVIVLETLAQLGIAGNCEGLLRSSSIFNCRIGGGEQLSAGSPRVVPRKVVRLFAMDAQCRESDSLWALIFSNSCWSKLGRPGAQSLWVSIDRSGTSPGSHRRRLLG